MSTGQITNRASLNLIAVIVVVTTAVLPVLVPASTDYVIEVATLTNNLNGVIELNTLGDGRRVVEEGDPSLASAVADTQVARSIVAPRVFRRTPLACLCNRDICWIKVVLRGGGSTLPVVVVVGIRAGKFVRFSGLCVNWNSLAFGAYKKISSQLAAIQEQKS